LRRHRKARVHGFVHDGGWMVTFLEGRDAVRKAHGQPDIIKAFQQAFASEGIDLEGESEPKVICKGLIFEVNGQPVSLIFLGPLE